MKTTISFLISFLVSFSVFANRPSSPDSVKLIKSSDEVQHENIPKISKIFRGAETRGEKAALERKCQQWVYDQTEKIDKGLFKVWCSVKKDVVVREFIITGNILLKAW